MTKTNEHNQRDLSGPAVLSAPQPLGELIMTVLRYMPAIIPFAILIAAGTYYVTTPTQPQAVATSEVGLTGEVVWPFFDSARLRTVTIAEDPEFLFQLEQALDGIEIDEFWVDMPDNQAYVALNATSDSATNAATIVNTAADMLLASDIERQAAAAIAEFEQVGIVLAASEERSNELSTFMDDFIIREAEARANLAANPLSVEAREAALAVDIERTGVEQALAEELRRQVQLQIDRDQAQSAVDNVVPELELLRRSNATDEPVQRSLIPVFAGFIAAMAAGLGMALVWDRSRGQLRSRWQAEHVSGVPVLAEIESGAKWRPSIDVFLATIADAAVDDQNIVAITGLPNAQAQRWMKMVVHYFEVSSLRVIALTHSSDESTPLGAGDEIKWNVVEDSTDLGETLHGVSSVILPSDLTVLDSALMRPVVHEMSEYCDIMLIDGGSVFEDHSEQALALADLSIVLVARKLHRVDVVRDAVAHVESGRSHFLGVVLTTPRPPKAKYKRPEEDGESLVLGALSRDD